MGKRDSLLQLCIDAEWKCALCGEWIERVEHASRDHVIPRFLGGRQIQLAHIWCNNLKGAKLPEGVTKESLWEERKRRQERTRLAAQPAAGAIALIGEQKGKEVRFRLACSGCNVFFMTPWKSAKRARKYVAKRNSGKPAYCSDACAEKAGYWDHFKEEQNNG